jgi:hypothetical protein
LFDKPEFEFHQDDFVVYIALQGKGDALDWLRENALKSRKEKPKQALANCVYLLASRIPGLRSDLVEMAMVLSEDDEPEIRASALHTIYQFASDGVSRVLRALEDRAPEVRSMAFEILSGKHFEVEEDFSVGREKTGRPDPALTPEIITSLLEDDDEFVFETVLDAISDGEIPKPPGLDLANLNRPPTDEVREALVKEWAREDTDESFEKIRVAALNDGSDFVRREAIDALKDSDRPLSDKFLRELFENETADWPRRSLDSLIEEKGGASLADIYVRILGREIDSYFSARDLFGKIVDSGDLAAVRDALAMCEQENSYKCVAGKIGRLVQMGLTGESEKPVEWCLKEGEEESFALLAAGLISTVPLDVISEYFHHEDPNLRAAAMRAWEKRLEDGSGLDKLKLLYEELKPGVLERDNHAMWASLEAIDGIIEFEGPEPAVPLLREYYGVVEKLIEGGSFPLRAAWERLRILGSPVSHPVYDTTDEAAPYPWPSVEGPYYGIKRV